MTAPLSEVPRLQDTENSPQFKGVFAISDKIKTGKLDSREKELQAPQVRYINPTSTVTQVRSYLSDHYDFELNEVTQRVEINGVAENDFLLNTIYLNCKSEIKEAKKDLVLDIIHSDYTPKYNPFKKFISENNNPSLKRENLDKLIASIVTDTDNYELFVEKWLVSLIGSALGKHSPLMLVLCGYSAEIDHQILAVVDH